MKITVKVMKNGIDQGIKLTPEQAGKINTQMISRAIYVCTMTVLQEIAEKHMEELKSKIHEKSMSSKWIAEHPEEVTMRYAYEKAIEASNYGSTVMSLINLDVLDKMLPMHGPGSSGKKGWWRLHESSRGMVGSSTRYGFLRKKGEGRFGEGIMVKVGDQIRPFRGFRPKRYLRSFQMNIKEELGDPILFRRVMDMAFNMVFRGV